jgi:hypothetical protein
MAIRNVHERRYRASAGEVGTLLDSLASSGDRLWPHERWPAMRLRGPLAPGAAGGHGPIRYAVEAYEPGRLIRFRFTRPHGFNGTHAFVVRADNSGHTVLRHELVMNTSGAARVTWPVVFRPLHDALIEDALDKAGSALGEGQPPRRWSLRVRMLRRVIQSRRR